MDDVQVFDDRPLDGISLGAVTGLVNGAVGRVGFGAVVGLVDGTVANLLVPLDDGLVLDDRPGVRGRDDLPADGERLWLLGTAQASPLSHELRQSQPGPGGVTSDNVEWIRHIPISIDGVGGRVVGKYERAGLGFV